jgi:hypothetical protein
LPYIVWRSLSCAMPKTETFWHLVLVLSFSNF